MPTIARAAGIAFACAWRELLAADPIPFKSAPDEWAVLWPVAAALGVLAVVAAAAVYASRRLGWQTGARPGRRMRIVERLPLSRHCALVLVECDGRVMLVGQSGERVCLIERGFEAGTPPPGPGHAP